MPIADEAAAAARLSLGGAPHAGIAGQRERAIQRRREVAAVVSEPRRRRVGVVVAPEEVRGGGSRRRPPGARGEQVEHPLHREDADGHADAAVGADRRLGRGHRERLERVGRHAVRARAGCPPRPAARAPRWPDATWYAPASRADARAEPEQAALAVRGELDGARAAPAPATRPARFSRRVSAHFTGRPVARESDDDGDDPRAGRHLLAEAAAGVRRDDADARSRRGRGRASQRGTDHERASGVLAQTVSASPSHAATRPRASSGEAETRPWSKVSRHDVGGAREGGVDVAVRAAHAARARCRRRSSCRRRRAGSERGVDVGERGQRLVLDRDELRGVRGDVRASSRPPRRPARPRNAARLGRERAHVVGREAGGGQARRDGRHRRSRSAPPSTAATPAKAVAASASTADDARMGVRAPDERGVEQAGRTEVVEVAAASREETRVLARA